MSYGLTYAGVPLSMDTARLVRIDMQPPEQEDQAQLPPRRHQPQADLIAEIDRHLPFAYLQDYTLRTAYPGPAVNALAYLPQLGPVPAPESHRIGDWYYPHGASRFSVFRGLVTSSQLRLMLASTGGDLPAAFVMQAPAQGAGVVSSTQVSSSMYMLPARPLADFGTDYEGLHLLTLVDERYYWQSLPASLQVVPGTTWVSLLSSLASILGASLNLSSIASVYGYPEPDSQLWSRGQSAAFLLDAVAFNLSRVVVRNLDGTYDLLTSDESWARVQNNRGPATSVVRVAGGDLFPTTALTRAGNLGNLRNSVVPAAVDVHFPAYVIGDDPVPHYRNSRYAGPRTSLRFEETPGDTYVVRVPITSGGDSVTGLTGTGIETIHDTAKALLSGEVAQVPLNSSGLTALAMAMAQDRYDDLARVALDEVYPGTRAWQPDGIHDIVWTYSARNGGATTRVLRPEWNNTAVQRQHAVPLSGAVTPAGVGGRSVALSIQDITLANHAANLASPLRSGDTSAIFVGTAHLPYDQNWKAQVNGEVILFAGTSGGIDVEAGQQVQVVRRGIEGTIPGNHAAGSQVRRQPAQPTHGTNLLTFGAGQFTFPGRWTSGGIQEAVVVPQTQSVKATSNRSNPVSGVAYYPAEIAAIGDCPGGAPALLIERNNVPLTMDRVYDGQFVGYSYSGSLPIYATTEGPGGGIMVSGTTEITYEGDVTYNYDGDIINNYESNVTNNYAGDSIVNNYNTTWVVNITENTTWNITNVTWVVNVYNWSWDISIWTVDVLSWDLTAVAITWNIGIWNLTVNNWNVYVSTVTWDVNVWQFDVTVVNVIADTTWNIGEDVTWAITGGTLTLSVDTLNIAVNAVNISQGNWTFGPNVYALFQGRMEICGWMLWCYTDIILADGANAGVAVVDSVIIFRLTAYAEASIQSLLPAYDKQVIALVNICGFDITLSHGVALNNIACPGATDLILKPYGAVMLWYDPDTLHWRVLTEVGTTSGGGGGGQGAIKAAYTILGADIEFSGGISNIWFSGPMITLPDVGNYEVWGEATVFSRLTPTFGGTDNDYVNMRLWDESQAAPVSGSYRFVLGVWCTALNTGFNYATGRSTAYIRNPTAGNRVLLQVHHRGTTQPGAHYHILRGTSGDATTAIGYMKISG